MLGELSVDNNRLPFKVQKPKQRDTLLIKSVTVGTPTTELDPVIANLVWNDAFAFGSGIDAITGNIMGSAIVPFTPHQRTVKTSYESYRFIQNESDLEREIEVSAAGKYNIEGITVSASSSYISKIKYSEFYTSLIAEYESQCAGYDEAESYFLTEAARRLIKEPAQFRQMYGDYFVSGGRRSSRFLAVYTCKASSAKNMDLFKASFGGAAPEIFSAEGSTAFLQSASQFNIETSIDLFMDGYTGNPPSGPWTPEAIRLALAWFKEHEQGIYFQAKLNHYSTIDPSYPRTIQIAPDVFIDLSLLYNTVWEVRSRYASCPPVYQEQCQNEYLDMNVGVIANQNILATDQEKRLEYQRKAQILLAKLHDVFERMDFYFAVKQTVSLEPANGHKIEEEGC